MAQHWQLRRAYARRLVALRAALRLARRDDTATAWREAYRAWCRAADWHSEAVRVTRVAAASAWRMHRLHAEAWNNCTRHGVHR